MKKTVTIATGIILLALFCAEAFAETSPDVATPASREPALEKPNDQSVGSPPAIPGHAGMSRRNRAKLEQEEQRKLRLEEIRKERADDGVAQQER